MSDPSNCQDDHHKTADPVDHRTVMEPVSSLLYRFRSQYLSLIPKNEKNAAGIVLDDYKWIENVLCIGSAIRMDR